LRGVDLNHRPLGYEPNELPGCSTPQIQYNSAFTCGQTREMVNAELGLQACVSHRFAALNAINEGSSFVPIGLFLVDVRHGQHGAFGAGCSDDLQSDW
jgi:hypothetical protein